MRKLHEILRLHLDAKLSLRQISRITHVSLGAVSKYLQLSQQHGLTEWPLPDHLGTDELQQLFFPKSQSQGARTGWVVPDWVVIEQEMKRKGVTLQLLWEEYAEIHGHSAWSYPQFCARFRQWQSAQRRSLRMIHKAGEKLFIDYCGPTVPVVTPGTGEIRPMQIFVATLGASSYTYIEATPSQSSENWLASHVRCFEFLGGVPELLIPDNLKAGVSKACLYDPDINPAYQQLAMHYRVTVVPARPYKPKDKAKVEVAVQVVERWVLARIRHQIFFSLAELNQTLRTLMDELNRRPFKGKPGSRHELFEALDFPALRPLPKTRFDLADIRRAKVHPDYHIECERHFYSVPHQLVSKTVEVHISESTLQIMFQGQKVAFHPRAFTPGYTTVNGHMPEKHRVIGQCHPDKLKARAQRIGPNVLRLVTRWLNQSTHPAQVYRRCIGLLGMSDTYPSQRIDTACLHALTLEIDRLARIKAILRSNSDLIPLEKEATVLAQHCPSHENLRDPRTFH